jgi:hypothetical protein
MSNSSNAAKNRSAGQQNTADAAAGKPAVAIGANPPAGDGATLNIPTMTGGAVLGAGSSTPPTAPVLQEGEDSSVLAGAGVAGGSPNMDAMQAQVMSQQEQAGEGSLADLQRKLDDEQRSGRAINRPVNMPRDREMQSSTPNISLEMPLTGSVDDMRRPDQYIEPVVDFGRFKDKAAELAFLEELVTIRIHGSGDPNAENPVVLGVNGRQVAILRDQDTIVRRKYVEQLLRSKPEAIATRQVRTGDGDVRNIIDKSRSLKYPFSIIRDENPLGRRWEARIRAEA